jgi:hypothetical protein
MTFVHNVFKRAFSPKQTRAMSKDNLLLSIYLLRGYRKTAYHTPIPIWSNEGRLIANGLRRRMIVFSEDRQESKKTDRFTFLSPGVRSLLTFQDRSLAIGDWMWICFRPRCNCDCSDGSEFGPTSGGPDFEWESDEKIPVRISYGMWSGYSWPNRPLSAVLSTSRSSWHLPWLQNLAPEHGLDVHDHDWLQ